MSRNMALGTLIATSLAIVLVFAASHTVGASGRYKTLHSFTRSDGIPQSSLIFDQAGHLYGTTRNGGPHGEGTVFKMTPNSDGTWKEQGIHSFSGTDGEYPQSNLIFDQAGNLYGTASQGIANHGGVVFKMTPDGEGGWNFGVLYSFCSLSKCADGTMPYAGLIFDQKGNLYGTTLGGGAGGDGVAFKLTPNSDGTWSESVLYSFCSVGNCRDGTTLFGGLIFDQTGNLYGTTFDGGSYGSGVVFKLSSGSDGHWKETVLHSFSGEEDGGNPRAGVIFDPAGNLYGTTEVGGKPSVQCDGYGCGVAFQLTPNQDGTWKERVLHHFTGGNDGGGPFAGLTFDAVGNLYGTTYFGGDICNCGVVFKLTPSSNGVWRETVPHNFDGQPGAQPITGLIFGPTGKIYGTAGTGAAWSFGSVFELTP